MKCPYCGAQIANDSLTCPNCGQVVQMTFDDPVDEPARPAGSAPGQSDAAGRTAHDASSVVGESAHSVGARPSGSRAGAAAGPSGATDGAQQASGKKTKEQRKADKSSKKAAKAEVKRTKSAYKSARRAAGKSATPRIVAIVIALLLAAAAGAYGMWSYSVANGIPFTDQQAAQAGGGDSGSSSDTSATESSSSDASASSESTSSASLLDGDADAYVGTWRGEMTQTKNESIGNDYRCYGASANPLEMTITQVDASGRIKADVKVLLHNHATDDLSSDSDSVDGDQVVELKNLTGTLKNGSFKFTPDISDYMKDGNMTISASVDSDDESKLDVLVRLDGVEDDEYVLAKDAGDSSEG